MAVANSVSGMKAVELILEQSRQDTEMLERLQRKAGLLIANMDVQATGWVHGHVEVFRQCSNHMLHPTQRLRTKAHRWRRDLNVALQKSVFGARTVLDVDGCVVGDRPFLVASGRCHVVSREAVCSEQMDEVFAEEDA